MKGVFDRLARGIKAVEVSVYKVCTFFIRVKFILIIMYLTLC